MKIYLDGNPIQYPNETLLKPSFTFRTSTFYGKQAIGFTGDLEFTDGDADYLKSILVTHPNALLNYVVLKFVDECCGDKDYLFAIRAASLEWCDGNCNLKAAAIEYTIIDQQLTCLKNVMIWDDYAGFKSKQHPRFSYCNEIRPNYMHDVLMILSIATATSILVFVPAIAALIVLFTTINLLISWANSILPSSSQINPLTFGGQTQIDLNTLQTYSNQLFALIAGCGRKHPSPLVRDYAANVCGKCGLTFKSSIFNDVNSEYYNTCYVNAPINKGTQEADTTTYWIDENKPILNGTQFFDQMSTIINGRWKIVANEVVLERWDTFITKPAWIDLTNHPGLQPEGVCWSWTKKPRYSYANLAYQKDGVNWVGSEAVSRWSDIVEWNVPYSQLQTDEWKPNIPFAACRFRDDGIDRDVLTAYEWAPSIGPMIKKYKRAMLMNSHTCFTPMLLIWDGVSRDNAFCINSNTYFANMPSEGDDNYQKLMQPNQFYNYPFWFNANFPGNLYDRFFFITNPRHPGWKAYDFVAKIQYTCADKRNLDIEGFALTNKGLARTEVVAIDEATGLMTINGYL